MDFREFQYVITIADCRSITEAAKQLYISQPSLSYALAKIEKEIGLKLFDRSKQPLTLTDAGQYYVTVARQFLRDKSNFQSHLADLKNGANGSISLGIPAERSGYMLPPVLPQFRQEFPGSSFYIQEASTTELFSLLRNNKVSFIVVPFNKEDLPAHLTAEYIYPEDLILVAGKSMFSPDMFLDRERRLIDLKKCADIPFIHIKKPILFMPKSTGCSRKPILPPISFWRKKAVSPLLNWLPAVWDSPLSPAGSVPFWARTGAITAIGVLPSQSTGKSMPFIKKPLT